MPGTYTHKFDTPVFKKDVTINTGYDVDLLPPTPIDTISLLFRLFINGQWVDPVEGKTIECVRCLTLFELIY